MLYLKWKRDKRIIGLQMETKKAKALPTFHTKPDIEFNSMFFKAIENPMGAPFKHDPTQLTFQSTYVS
ncbi:hypothetical protein L6452_44541 [Arctium lappa]|uniref:Uncharacterized protein n=1 Tax=Arctium lappa TaxID=4217 RepID=A0ACB8XH54_ARCLA|nr:hypothetical protein L6452_44541 [Arctium lappa]